jgi:myo-inositol-1(or 4)-monophosphatase
MTASPDILARLALAQAIGRAAGVKALDYFNRRDQLVIEEKANPQDVVSSADREVEQLIRAEIAALYPDDGVLGEEYGSTDGTSGFTWVVDPIDGTSPFVFGMPNWCVSIAVVKNEALVIGVVYAPVTDDLYAAASGHGATLNGKRLKLDPARTIANSIVGIGSNHHADPAEVGGVIEKLLSQGGNFFRNGSGAMMLAYVAAGRLAGYYEPSMNAWDCLGGYCLVAEAGGWHLPFPLHGDQLTQRAPVCAAGPGAKNELCALIGGLELLTNR